MKRCPLGLACVVIAAGGVPALASGASPRPGDATADAGYSLAFGLPASGVSRAFPAVAAPGDLDVSFSGDGKQTTDFGGSDLAAAVAVQADGKIVVAGSSDGNFALARYGVDGALDPSFSGDGLVTTDIGGTDDGQGVAIQPDGKIVVAGGSEGNFALARYTTGGGLDPSFSGDGKQTTDFGLEDRATAVALQADGRIVVGGIVRRRFRAGSVRRCRRARPIVQRRWPADHRLRWVRLRSRRGDRRRRQDRPHGHARVVMRRTSPWPATPPAVSSIRPSMASAG